MAGVIGSPTVTGRLSAAADKAGDGARTQVAQFGESAQQIVLLLLQLRQGRWHGGTPSLNVLYMFRPQLQKRKHPPLHFHVAPPPTKIPTGSPLFIRYASSSAVCPALSPFPPRHRKAFHEAVLEEILQERVSSSRNRLNPRGVKRKMSNYPLRPRQPERTRRIDFAKQIRILK